LQGECIYYDSYSYYELSFGYEEPLTLPTNIVEFSKSCGIGWGNAFGEASMGQGGDCCCGFLGPCGGGCVALTITSWGPTNLRQYVCGAEQRGRVNFAAPVTRERPVPCNGLAYGYGISFGSCTPFNVGYCRKSNCQTCGETLQSETAINFEYQWQYCRTNFNTFGHIYRQVNQWDFTPIIVQPRPPDCYTYPVSGPFGDQCGNIPPGGSNQNGSTITTCTTYPVVGLTRSQMDDLRRNNILLGATAGTAYNCPDQSNGYLPPVPFERCFPVYGRGRACNDNPKSCTLQGCPDPFSSLSPSNGCSAGDCDFCYDPSSSYIMLNDNIDSGFEYPTGKCDKYCHFCGVGRMGSHNILSKNRVFLKTTTTNNPPYNPLCASTLCTISYTSSSITLTIGSKTICFSKSTLRCPKIEINSSMSQLNVVDSVQSSCDECIGSSMKVSIPEQKQLFVTKTENRRCLLSTFTTCSVNAPGLVGGGWQAYEHHASWLLQCGGGAPQYGCGQLGGRIYDNPDLTMDITYECLKGLACSVPARVAPYVVEETLWRLGTQLKNRFIYLAKGSAHIPTEDIIEGIVPGSVSSVIMESFNSGGVSITRDGDIQNDVSTTYAFYYTYNYIRPVTIQDIMRNDSSIICSVDSFEVNSTNTYSHCTNLPFPSQYASNLDLYRAHQFNLNKTGYLDGVSYTNTNPTYYQASSCDGAISCYYKHRVFICGVGDFCCMADLGVIKNEGIGTSCADINAPFTPVGPTL
jgi:hypothetical protein